MLAKSLKDAGFAVVAHDPMASGPAKTVLGDAARFVTTARETIAQADVAVIITPWPEYAEISPDWVDHGRTRFIIDCWRQLASGVVRRPLQDRALGAPGNDCGRGQARWPRNERSARRSPRPRMNFFSPYRHEFLRVAACVPRIGVGDPAFNVAQTLDLVRARRRAEDRAHDLSRAWNFRLCDRRSSVPGRTARSGRDGARSKLPRRRANCFPPWSLARRCAGAANCSTAPSSSTAARFSASCRKPICPTIANSTRCASAPQGRESATRPSTSPASHRAVRRRPAVPVARLRAVHSPCRDLRGRLGAAAAFDGGGARRRGDSAQPLRQQYHHRQGGHAPAVMRVAVGALHCRLCLFGRRSGRIHHRSGLGRPRSSLRVRHRACRDRAVLAAADHGRRRRRSGAAAPGAHARGHLQRLHSAQPRSRGRFQNDRI